MMFQIIIFGIDEIRRCQEYYSCICET